MAEETGYGESPGGEEEQHAIVATEHALVIALNEEQRKQARSCLERSGRITFSIKEISVTRLPETLLQDGVLID
jgi:hypothetical protein